MPAITDFRGAAFDAIRIDRCAKDVGGRVYWKLYALENILRVIINSVLTAQFGAAWWGVAVGKSIRDEVERFRKTYAKAPWHGLPGNHDIYYTHISTLGVIIRLNSHLFLPLVHDVDAWIARIEQVRLPRNIVGHMNWPSPTDRARIDVMYADVKALATHLAASGLTMVVPP